MKNFFFTLIAGIAINLLFLSWSSANAQTIHAIIVADTNDRNIGVSVNSDRKNMVSFLENAARATGMRLNLQQLYGADCNHATVRQAITSLQSQADDVVVFYYSGHGHRWDSTQGKWPLLSLNRELPFSWVIQNIESKTARMHLSVTDSCNISLDDGFPLTGAEIPSASTVTYRRLFKDFSGKIRASGSSVGEYSYGPSSGGIFTSNFLVSVSKDLPSWEGILNRTKSAVAEATKDFPRKPDSNRPGRFLNIQNPQFEIDGSYVIPRGYFDNGTAVFFSNGSSYCAFVTPGHLRFYQSVVKAPGLGRRSPAGRDTGICALPSGYLDDGHAVFFTPGDGTVCAFPNPQALDSHSKARPTLPRYGRIDIDPKRFMTYTDACRQ